MKVKDAMTLPILVDENMRIIPEVLDFVDSLQVRGKSVNTIRSYLYDLKLFYEWLGQQSAQFYEIKPENIITFLRLLTIIITDLQLVLIECWPPYLRFIDIISL